MNLILVCCDVYGILGYLPLHIWYIRESAFSMLRCILNSVGRLPLHVVYPIFVTGSHCIGMQKILKWSHWNEKIIIPQTEFFMYFWSNSQFYLSLVVYPVTRKDSFAWVNTLELQLNKANTSDTETSFLDLNIKVIGSNIHTSVCDKCDDFGFPVVNFPWLSGDVPRLPLYGTVNLVIFAVGKKI